MLFLYDLENFYTSVLFVSLVLTTYNKEKKYKKH